MTTPKNKTGKRSPSRHIKNGPVNAERRFAGVQAVTESWQSCGMDALRESGFAAT